MRTAFIITAVISAIIAFGGLVAIFFPMFAPLWGVSALAVAHYGAIGMVCAFVGCFGLITSIDNLN